MEKGKNRRKKKHLRLVDESDSEHVSESEGSDYSNFPFEIGEDQLYKISHSLKKMPPQGQEGNWRHPGFSGEAQTEGLPQNVKEENRQTSDDLLFEKVCQTLMRHHDIDASEIGVKVSRGIVFLAGKVTSRWMKKLSQKIIEDLPGVQGVRNELTIVPGHDNPRGPDRAVRKDLGIS
jgi:hypothetical protein